MIRFYSDLEQLTDASDVDTLRNGLSIAGVSHDQNRVKPSTLTLATWWLNKARAAMYQDTGIISAYDYRTRISAWRQYPELAPEFPNIVEVDWYKLNNHQMLHEVCIMFMRFLAFLLIFWWQLMHTWPAVGGDDAIFEELIEDVEYGSSEDAIKYLGVRSDIFICRLYGLQRDLRENGGRWSREKCWYLATPPFCHETPSNTIAVDSYIYLAIRKSHRTDINGKVPG